MIVSIRPFVVMERLSHPSLDPKNRIECRMMRTRVWCGFPIFRYATGGRIRIRCDRTQKDRPWGWGSIPIFRALSLTTSSLKFVIMRGITQVHYSVLFLIWAFFHSHVEGFSNLPLTRKIDTSSCSCRSINQVSIKLSKDKDREDGKESVADIGSFPEEQSFVDTALQWVVSDIGSLVLGISGIVIVLIGGVLSLSGIDENADSMTAETRVNLLAILSCGAVLSNGLSKLDITSVAAETVELQGVLVKNPVILTHGDSYKTNFSWILTAVLTATSAMTAVILEQKGSSTANPNKDTMWNVLGFGGIVSGDLRHCVLNEGGKEEGPIMMTTKGSGTHILNRLALSIVQEIDEETYLPNLPALPGRIEFDSILPTNTQAALLVPIAGMDDEDVRVLVMGSNQARSFSPKDIAWCRAAVGCLQT